MACFKDQNSSWTQSWRVFQLTHCQHLSFSQLTFSKTPCPRLLPSAGSRCHRAPRYGKDRWRRADWIEQCPHWTHPLPRRCIHFQRRGHPSVYGFQVPKDPACLPRYTVFPTASMTHPPRHASHSDRSSRLTAPTNPNLRFLGCTPCRWGCWPPLYLCLQTRLHEWPLFHS